jgi:uncharacterized protein
VSSAPHDRFARLAALQPGRSGKRRGAPTGSLPPAADELAELLGARVERNRSGEYLAARQWFAAPAALVPAPEALRLLAPAASGNDGIAEPESWLFLDTETTGLAGGTGTYAFLIGLAWWEAGGLAVEQLFMRDHSEEHAVLRALAGRLAERRVLVTFNGKCFDWPLVETRFRMTRQIEAPAPRAHLDLLHPARQVWRLRLGSVRLPELERQILGLDRGPDIASELIPQIYFDFLRGAGARALALVFRHNQMDLRGLATLAGHLTDLLAAPQEARAEPLDLYGLCRLLTRRGELGEAQRLYERTLDAGLPGFADRAARRDLARLAKRRRDFPRANELWGELSGRLAAAALRSSAGFGRWAAEEVEAALEASEQLAIHYEHRAREPERAAELTRAALAALGNARVARALDPSRQRRWQGRFLRRLGRLTGRR